MKYAYKMDHMLLKLKLPLYDIQQEELEWFSSYLSNPDSIIDLPKCTHILVIFNLKYNFWISVYTFTYKMVILRRQQVIRCKEVYWAL